MPRRLLVASVAAAAALLPLSSKAVENLSTPVEVSSEAGGPSTNNTPEADENSIRSKTGFYVTGAAGGNWPQNVNVYEVTDFFGQEYGFVENHFGGISIETGLGYDFGGLRVEATYAYDGSSLAGYEDSFDSYTYSGGTVSKNSVFASAYWDINVKGRVKPYIGGGIGYSNLRVDETTDEINSYSGYTAGGFGYQAKAGLRYLASLRTDVFAEAVYRGMAGYTANDGPFVYQYGNYNSWGFQLGTRIRF
jgi:opacity protein-like surface antigen